jgi:drug/metabolite transporter (DMT)-like permease
VNAPPPQSPAISVTDWGLICTLAAFWGGSFVLAKIAVFEIPAITISLIRVSAAAVLLWMLCRALGYAMPADAKSWRRFVPLAIFNNVIPFTLMYGAQFYIPSGLGAILNATTPFFAIAIAGLVTREEPITPGRLIGLIAGFAGVVITIGPDLLRELGSHVIAQLACLVAALSFAVATVYGRVFRGEEPFVVATSQLAVSAVVLVPLSLLIDQPWTLPAPSLKAIGALAGLTLFSTMFAYMLFFTLLKRVGATNVLLVTFLQPAAAILLAWLAFGEQLSVMQALGVAAILIGLAAIDGRAPRMIANAWRVRRSEGV